MKNLYLITMTVISITISFNSYSQWVSLTECEFYGQASDIAETADGGIVACGWLSSEPSFYVTKINASGVNEWETIIDHPDFHDYAYNILSDDDGGFIIAGQDTYFATPFFAKLDASGDLLWTSAAWSDTISSPIFSNKSVLLGDGNIAFIGTHFLSNYFTILKVSSDDGSLLEYISSDTLSPDLIFISSIADITPTTDGGFSITGAALTSPAFTTVSYIVKYAEDLSMDWSNMYSTTDDANAEGICATADNGFLISGYNQSSDFFTEQETFVLRTNASGEMEWLQYYEAIYTFATGYDVAEMTDGSIYLIEGGGDYIFPDLTREAQLFHLTETGDVISSSLYAPAEVMYLNRIKADSDGSIMLSGMISTDPTGATNNYFTVIKSNVAGNLPDCIINCVWPGDADNNGNADMDDLLAIGLVYGTEGSTRDDASIEWYGHASDAWGDSTLTGTDYKYADCNGDGIISEDDTAAIVLNFGFEHALFSMKTSVTDIVLRASPDIDIIGGGMISIPIMLENVGSDIDAIYGLRFDATITSYYIDPLTVSITFNESVLGTDDELMSLAIAESANILVHAGLVRKDQTNISTHGKVADLHFYYDEAFTDDFQIQIDNVRAITATNEELEISGATTDYPVLNGIDAITNNGVQLFPNPANTVLQIQMPTTQNGNYSVWSLTGSLIFEAQFTTTDLISIDIADLPEGNYVVRINSDTVIAQKYFTRIK